MYIDDLTQKVDIVELISQYVDLSEHHGEYWGLSPFKPEKTPSFSVRRETGKFYDFSTGIGGSAVAFLQHYYNISTQDAIQKLKEYAGVDDQIFAPKDRMSATMVCKKFTKPKPAVKRDETTILPDDYMERYEKRDDMLAVWEQEGISRESLDKFQVFYDPFSNRLVYPIRNIGGKIVNVGGRTMDPEFKEHNQRKYMYFYPWGTINTIYGIAENSKDIKKSGEVIIFEGCKSVLLADTWGIHNAGAILTSHLSQNQLKILAKLCCRVVFALDNDVNILKDHNIQKLKRYITVEYIKDVDGLLDDKDAPVDKGREVFDALYRKRIRLG